MSSPAPLIVHGRAAAPATPLVLDSPHSGFDFPADFNAAVSEFDLRDGEDCFVDELYRPAAERDERRIAVLRDRAQYVARVLGALLGDAPYFAGELSIADIQLYAATSKAIEAGVFTDPPANLVAWLARMNERRTVREARAQYVPYR